MATSGPLFCPRRLFAWQCCDGVSVVWRVAARTRHRRAGRQVGRQVCADLEVVAYGESPDLMSPPERGNPPQHNAAHCPSQRHARASSQGYLVLDARCRRLCLAMTHDRCCRTTVSGCRWCSAAVHGDNSLT